MLPTHRHYLIISRLRAAVLARTLDALKVSSYREGTPEEIDELIGWVHISVKRWCEEERINYVNNRR